MDLSTPGGPDSLVEAADRLAFEPNVLVNSAGFGVLGAFAEEPLERQLAMIRLNVLVLVALTGAYVPRMIRRADGVVVNVASTAALQPLPYMAAYAASKAFMLSFGEALWAETRKAGVHTVTVCPGPVSTPFHESGGNPTDVRLQRRRGYVSTDAVVAATFAALEADRPRAVVRVPGGWSRLYAASTKVSLFVPRRWAMLASERLSRWMFPRS